MGEVEINTQVDRVRAAGADRLRDPAGLLERGALWAGGVCLFAAVACDFGSVVARHLGLVLFGATEIVRLLIVGIVAAALVHATLRRAHAAVHLLATALSPRWRALQTRASNVVTALLLLVLLGSTLWVSVLLWPLDERTQLLGVPMAPARALWALALLLAGVIAARGAVRGR